MKTDILYDSHSTASNRYYESKTSINRRPVEVTRPIVEVHNRENFCRAKADVSETIVNRGYELLKR